VTVDPAGELAPEWSRRFPAGSRAEVWVNPADPGDAVAVRGFTRLVFLFCLGWAMFFGMGLVFAADAVDAVIWRARRLAAGVTTHRRPFGWLVRVPSMHPSAFGAGFGSIASMIVIVAFLFRSAAIGQPLISGGEASLWLVAVIVPGIVGYAWKRYALVRGRRDLVIDLIGGRLVAPRGPARARAIVIPLAAIRDVDIVTWDHTSQTQYGAVTTYTFVPTIVYRSDGGGWRNCHLVEWRDEDKALALARWLRRNALPEGGRVGKGGRGPGGEVIPSILEGIQDQ
jgi:hypothetical protein